MYTETEEEEHKRRQGEEDTLHEQQRRALGTEHKSMHRLEAREKRAKEPPLVPASSQTNGPSPDAEVARFLRRSFKFTFTD